MIILITGASHTGKTRLAQRMLEEYKYPYLSIDHLKMGLIRSGKTGLTPKDAYPQTRFYTSHCTGDTAFTTLHQVMGDKIHAFSCGTIKCEV